MMSKNPFSAGISFDAGDLTRVNSHIPASTRLYGEIRSEIVSLMLPPETTLVRSELAERFRVSQSPVREAIMRLEQDGLVVSYPQSRTVVTKIDIARIREEHFLRSAVECDVVRQLATSGDASTTLKINGLIKMQEALVGEVEQIDLFKQLDEAFHEALFLAVGQTNLYLHITARCGNLARVRSLDLPRSGKMGSVLNGHQAIAKAIEAGDGEKASLTMRKHLSGTMERLPEIINEHQELFS